MTFKRVGTRIYAENGALVRKFEHPFPLKRVRPNGSFYYAAEPAIELARRLNGCGPRAERARQEVGL